jgi:class 3 adenylate cyclase
MDQIAEQFKASAKPAHNQMPSETAGRKGSEGQLTQTAIFGPLSLSPDQIEAPSFFVDKKLSVVWMNPGGTDAFSLALAQELRSAGTGNIFELLLKPAIKDSIGDWQALFSFVYILLRRSTAKDTFDRETVFISRNHLPATDVETALAPSIHPFLVDSCIIGQKDEASHAALRMFGMEFKEGSLFLLRQDPWHAAATIHGETEPAVTDIEPGDEKEAICILSARLNDSHRIAESMLPAVFFKLMHRIWDESDSVVSSFGGKRAGCGGAQIDYLFTKNAGRNPIFSAICCATRMNRQMRVMEETLKAQQGWADEIRMNMGISHGTDELTTSAPTGCMESTLPGGTFDQSSHLSTVAGKGEIWITRNAVAQLPRKLIDRVVVGIDRQGRFLRNFFTRLSDLPQATGTGQPHPDLGTLSIARILTIEKPGPEQPVTNED